MNLLYDSPLLRFSRTILFSLALTQNKQLLCTANSGHHSKVQGADVEQGV
jgi:hypothetical protein